MRSAARDVRRSRRPAEAAQWRQLHELEATRIEVACRRARHAMRWPSVRGCCAARSAWQLDAAYKLRWSRLRASLRETDAALDEARRRYALVEQAGELAPRNTAGFASRVRELEQRMASLQPRIDAAAGAQERRWRASQFANSRRRRHGSASYATQAQFALASLYDGAASGGTR